MTSRSREGEGVENSMAVCDEVGRGVRNIVISQKSSYNKYDSMGAGSNSHTFRTRSRQLAAVDERVDGGRS
jgi:hypothetical protein